MYCLHYKASTSQLAMQTILDSFSCNSFLKHVFLMLPVTPFLAEILSTSQHQLVDFPLSTVSWLFPCLLGVLLATATLPKGTTYLPYELPVAATAFLVAHSPPVVGLFWYFLCASPWPNLFSIPSFVLPGGLFIQLPWI